MKLHISPFRADELTVTLVAETDEEADTLRVIGAMKFQAVSVYAETEAGVYGATAGRKDGQVMIGPGGEPPSATINLF